MQHLTQAWIGFSVLSIALPHIISTQLLTNYKPSVQQYQLIKSFSLLLLGMFLASLATLNFSLAFIVGLLASPLTFTRPWPSSTAMRWVHYLFLASTSPSAVVVACSMAWGIGLRDTLEAAAFGWDVWGMYTAIVVWGVFWPAHLVGSIVVLGKPVSKEKTS